MALGSNPTQFSSQEDYERFPRDVNRDLDWLREEALVDAVLLVKSAELFRYGPHHGARVRLESDILPSAEYVDAKVLEGEATTLVKLLNVVRPTRVYLGERDIIKTTILRRIIDDLHLPVDVLALPTVRNENGVAWDARLRLLPVPSLYVLEAVYGALRLVVSAYLADEFDAARLIQIAHNALESCPELQVDFVRVAHPFGFQDVSQVEPAVGAIAIIRVRLQGSIHMDNVILAPTIPRNEQSLWGLVRSTIVKK